MAVLYARVAGAWVPVGSGAGGGGGAEEVAIQAADPGGTYDLWYDTDAVGVDADPVRQWNAAWGIVIGRTGSSNVALSSTTQTTLHTMPGTFVAGRRYAVRLGNAASYASTVGDTWDFGASVDGVSIGSQFSQVDSANLYLAPVMYDMPFTTTTGAHTITVWGKRSTGAGTCQARWYAEVLDNGPVTGFTAPPDPTPAWIPATLASPWVNDASCSVAYRKLGDMVQIRGTAKTGAAGSAIFTLPVGYRPTYQLIFSVDSGNAHGRVDVFNDGRVFAQVGSVNWFGLSGIQFSVTT